jgi:hypothetical protein
MAKLQSGQIVHHCHLNQNRKDKLLLVSMTMSLCREIGLLFWSSMLKLHHMNNLYTQIHRLWRYYSAIQYQVVMYVF